MGSDGLSSARQAELRAATRLLRERATAHLADPNAAAPPTLGEPVDAALATVDALVPDPFHDLDAARAAGIVHWLREDVLPPGVDGRELELMGFWLGAAELAEPGRSGASPTRYFGRNAAACAVASVALPRVQEGRAGTASDGLLDSVIGHLAAIGGDEHWQCHSRAFHLALLAQAYLVRCERTGDATDAAAAVTCAQTASEAVAVDDPDHRRVLISQAVAFMLGLRFGGGPGEITEAVHLWGGLVDTWPEWDAEQLPAALHNLAMALRTRAELTGSQADLDEAIRLHRRCLALIARDHPLRPQALALLSGALRLRYETLGHLDDLDAQLGAAREAVELRVPSPAMAGLAWAHLSMAHHTRYGRTGDPLDLDAAEDASRAAVRFFDPRSTDRAITLANHARLLQLRAETSRCPDDVDAALAAADTGLAALAATGVGDFLAQPVANAHLNRCNTLLTRAESTRSEADALAALEAADRVVEAAPSGSGLRSAGLYAVGNAHRLAAECLADAEDRATAHTRAAIAYRRALGDPAAPPVGAALAAAALGENAARAGDPTAAADAYATAIERLIALAPPALRRADGESRLTALRGLASEALACCLEAGRVAEGVLLFERGRGVILRQALAARTDLTELTEVAPDLAARLHALRTALSAPEGETPSPADTGLRVDSLDWLLDGITDPVERRRRIADEIEVVLGRARTEAALPGFLNPPGLAELSTAAGENGAIVVVNVSELRSDAVLLRAGRAPEVVRLPLLTPAFAADRTERLGRALHTAADTTDTGAAEAAETEIDGILTDLWDVVTGPVLDALGHHTVADGPLPDRPRVWWCPAGALSALPLHASGRTETRFDDVPLTVPDRVVSSYTPTLDSLLPRSTGGTGGAPAHTLVVATATAPGVRADAEDPNTLTEADAVTRLAPGPVTRLIGPDATRARVEEALGTARRAHFACHADTDPRDPAAGRLRLADHDDRPFDVTAISALDLSAAEFAFLAACSTAAPGLRNPDEAVHLASGFRLAGFRQVVGTLWPLFGDPVLAVVEYVHAAVAASGPEVAAAALHEAVLDLRSTWSDQPSVWAGLLHVGGIEPTTPREKEHT
ncbi:CHAT domain-containing protein [Streptomyces sp. NPDC094468]|uniref:CHAT domain-containing protein n=1 Tax=Streptomyces sp. NPDC094468 TaxID=3366066 RepID=UPI0038052000